MKTIIYLILLHNTTEYRQVNACRTEKHNNVHLLNVFLYINKNVREITDYE